MHALLLASALAQRALAADAPPPSAEISASTPVASLYSVGMDQRKSGDYAAALKTFQRLLDADPKNGGAFEGLTLTSLAMGRNEDALKYIEQWEKLGESDYVRALKERALAALHPAAPPAASTAPAPAPPLSGYALGMEQRRRGDLQGAKKTFLQMLAEDPQSGGALEGLTIVSLSLGENQAGLDYADRWAKQGDSAYIESFRGRALSRLNRREEYAAALEKAEALDPRDLLTARRLDDLLRSDARGIFPSAAAYKTISQEGLGTASNVTVLYEGRSAGASERIPLARGLNAVAGETVSETAQRNASASFSYFDILDQAYSGTLEARKGSAWGFAQYGESLLSDVKGHGLGRQTFSRVKANGNVDIGDLELRGTLERAPYYLRGAGGSQYFALLREDSAKAEAETPLGGALWLARASLIDYSDHVTVNSESLSATVEGGSTLANASVSHSYQEFFGAGATGQLTIMPYDRASLRGRYGTDGEWLAGASYGHSNYRDGNRENDAAADARVWSPWGRQALGQVWGSYRFSIEEYLVIANGYHSNDTRSHWAGVFWRRQWGNGPWTQASYEHGFLDDLRGQYEGNLWTGELEWHRGRPFSLLVDGKYSYTTVRDQTVAGELKARWTF